MGYEPSWDDNHMRMQSKVKPDGFEYWEYLICCIDDVISISDYPTITIKDIKFKFKLKGYNI